jgi:UDPglucose--hexose-1-phosphate uridylyltransferase
MIRFIADKIPVPLYLADGREQRVEVELRRDPLSGEQCRITPRRPSTRPARKGAREDAPAGPPVEGRPCPLCPDAIAGATPRLDPGIFATERLRRGEAVLFPNLFPYGRWSAVIALTEAHWLSLEHYTAAQYADGIRVALDYADALIPRGHGPWLAITQNHLPTSGGTLLHPHLQVHVDETPNNFFARASEAARRHRELEGEDYFEALVAAERDGERWITERDGVNWLCPFAPRGFFEFWAMLPGKRSLRGLTTGEIAALSEELVQIFAFYRHLGWDAFNLAITANEDPASDLPVWLRVVLRGRYSAYARSDVSFHEKLFEELSLSMSPEESAGLYRAFRTNA